MGKQRSNRQQDRHMSDITTSTLKSSMYNGRILKYLTGKKKVVKIFLSSTFTDMYVERNYLMTDVYPNLQTYCRDKFDVEFQVVDMRWGVIDEASKDHSASKICMAELEACQKLSIGPNFVCLLGQRYGSRPLQAKILKSEFDIIVESARQLGDGDAGVVDTELLLDWYKCDENGVPPVMILTPLNIRTPEVSTRDFQPISEKLHTALRKGAQKAVKDGKLDNEKARKYIWSVTEEEIYNGILKLPPEEARKHALCFQRTLTDVDYSESKTWRFVDMLPDPKTGSYSKEVDMEAQDLLTKLTDGIKIHLGKDNCHSYTVKWEKEVGTSLESLKSSLEEFGKIFEKKIMQLIDQEMNTDIAHIIMTADPRNAGLITEIIEHNTQALAKVETFQGREDILDQIKAYIDAETTGPMVIYGESGCGKTSLLAYASTKVFDWLSQNEDLVVVRRFLGTTPESTNVESLVNGIVRQLVLALDMEITSLPNDHEQLLHVVLPLVNRPIVIFLDSLDQLSSYGKAFLLKWLPLEFNSNIKVVLSTLTKEHGIFDRLSHRLKDATHIVEIKRWSPALSISLINNWLQNENRTLTKAQMEVVEKRFSGDSVTTPLHIKLIYDVILAKIPSYDPADKLADILTGLDSPKQCIRYIFKTLGERNGKLFVHRAFAYIHLSINGLTENELIDILSIDDEVLTDVFQYSDPPLRRFPAVLWARVLNSISGYMVTRDSSGGKVLAWYHRQFVETGKEVFVNSLESWNQARPYRRSNSNSEPESEDEFETQNTQQRLMETLIEYFTGKWSGGRKKPFKYSESLMKKKNLDSPYSEADRFVPAMPNILSNGRPNLRKLGQLPMLLVRLEHFDRFFDEIYGDIGGLTAMFKVYSWAEILSILSTITSQRRRIGGVRAQGREMLENSFKVMQRLLIVSSSTLKDHPSTLAPTICGRILPYAAGSYLLRRLVDSIYEKGPKENAFVCTHNQLDGLGSNLVVEMAHQHDGPCHTMFVLGRKYVCTLSRRVVVLALESGAVAMNYQPKIMKKDDKFHLQTIIETNDSTGSATFMVSQHSVPVVSVISTADAEVTLTIDLRNHDGLEEFQIRAMNYGHELVYFGGLPGQGALLYDMESSTIRHKFTKDFIHEKFTSGGYLTLITHDFRIMYFDLRCVSKDDDSAKTDCYMVSGLKLPFPKFQPTASDFLDVWLDSKSCILSLGADDGTFYTAFIPDAGRNDVMHSQSIILDSAICSISTFAKVNDGETWQICYAICTDEFAYIIVALKSMLTYEVTKLSIIHKFKAQLDSLKFVDETRLIGYRLTQVYVFTLNGIGDQLKNGEELILALVNSFSDHPMPIIDSYCSGKLERDMLMTCAEDGGFRVFHGTLELHPLLKATGVFDKNGFMSDSISTCDDIAACVSAVTNVINCWNSMTGKIVATMKMDHSESADLIAVIQLKSVTVTLDKKGIVSIWNSKVKELVHQETFSEVVKMHKDNDNPNTVIVACKDAIYWLDTVSLEIVKDFTLSSSSKLLSLSYISDQIAYLKKKQGTDEALIEILNACMQPCELLGTAHLSDIPGVECFGVFKDFVCIDRMLVLVFAKAAIFYNWKTKEILQVEKIRGLRLIISNSDTFLLRSTQQLTSYKVMPHGITKLSQSDTKKSHNALISPDGGHVLVVEAKKILNLYRVSDLTSSIGIYCTTTEVDRILFSEDSKHVIWLMPDTRLFFLMICDVQVPSHASRVKNLLPETYSEEEVANSTIISNNLIINAPITSGVDKQKCVLQNQCNLIGNAEVSQKLIHKAAVLRGILDQLV